MKWLTIAALGTLALGGCTGAHIKKPAVCDGKHRRPANLYGSVLPTLPIPLPASQSGGQSMVAPGPGPRPGTLPAPPSEPAPSTTPRPNAGGRLDPPQTGATTTSHTSRRDVTLPYSSC